MSVLTDAPAVVLLRVHWGLTALGSQKEHSPPSQMVERVHSETAEYNSILFTSLSPPLSCFNSVIGSTGIRLA